MVRKVLMRYSQAFTNGLETLKTTKQQRTLWFYGATALVHKTEINMSAGLINFLASATNIHTIEHKFIEAGHTFVEVDSIHSAIERSTRHK